jgi:hypothetical protein
LGVSTSGYHEYRRRSGTPAQPGKRIGNDALLVLHIPVIVTDEIAIVTGASGIVTD